MIKKLNLPQQIQDNILNEYQRNPKFYDGQAQIAYTGDAPDYPICKRGPFHRAVIICRCLETLYARYQATGLPEQFVWATFSDITLRIGLYQKKHGKIGLSKEDVIWFRHLWCCEIFQIGSLQYHKFHMLYLDMEGIGQDYMTFAEKPVSPGEPVWNIHVPRGTDLTPESVSESMDTAIKLLPKIFPEHEAEYFLCYSWLLYPGLKHLLPKTNNILDFANRFSVIGIVQDPSEAISCIYGKYYPRKAMYPIETTLQRNALGHISQLGYGCGLRKMDIT